jgi:hypothetical protein
LLTGHCVGAFVACLGCAAPTLADITPQPLPFSQNWFDWSLITQDDDWSGVPGIVGYRGDGLVDIAGADPQTILGDDATTALDVDANEWSPNTLLPGGLAEFQIVNSTVALSGSDTADAPHMVLALNTSGFEDVVVSYVLADLDTSARNAVSPVAMQYRVGHRGSFVNVPAAFVADASTGPNHGMATPVSATLPAQAANQPQVQVRIITANALGEDEWIGVGAISVTGTPINDCLADVNGSGAVDADDLTAVILAWGACPAGPPPQPCSADVNDSGAVDADDLVAVILAWGPCASR